MGCCEEPTLCCPWLNEGEGGCCQPWEQCARNWCCDPTIGEIMCGDYCCPAGDVCTTVDTECCNAPRVCPTPGNPSITHCCPQVSVRARAATAPPMLRHRDASYLRAQGSSCTGTDCCPNLRVCNGGCCPEGTKCTSASNMCCPDALVCDMEPWLCCNTYCNSAGYCEPSDGNATATDANGKPRLSPEVAPIML